MNAEPSAEQLLLKIMIRDELDLLVDNVNIAVTAFICNRTARTLNDMRSAYNRLGFLVTHASEAADNDLWDFTLLDYAMEYERVHGRE